MVVVRASGPDGASLVRSRPRRRWVGASIAGHTGTRHVCRVTAPVMIMVPRQRQGDRQSITRRVDLLLLARRELASITATTAYSS